MRGYIDVTGFGDTAPRVIAVGEVITDPEVIARMDAERERQLRVWHEQEEALAIAEGYESLDQKLEEEYRHGPRIRRQKE